MRTSCNKDKLPVSEDGQTMLPSLEVQIEGGDQGLAEARLQLAFSLVLNRKRLLNQELLPSSVDLPFRLFP